MSTNCFANSEITIDGIVVSPHTIQDEGTSISPRDYINFVGTGVTAANSGNKTVVTIDGIGAITLDNLTDVNTTGVATSDTIIYNGSTWGVGSGSGVTDADYLVGTANGTLSAEIVVGTTPSGDLGGTWGNISVDDDSHAHTGSTLSGIDISDDTNLAGDTEIVLTGDALSIASTITRDTELSAYQTVLTNSAGLAGALNDETGTGLAVFNTLPVLTNTSAGALITQLRLINSSSTVGTGSRLAFRALNSGATAFTYGRISTEVDVNTTSSETGTMRLSLIGGGAWDDILILDGATKLATFAGGVTAAGDLTVTGGDITLGTTSIFSGGDTASLNNVDAIDATTETTLEGALDIAGEVTSTGMASTVIADNVAVTSWNLTTPTITTSLTTSTPTTLSVAELDRLDGLAGVIVTDTTACTEIDGTNLTITAGTLNIDNPIVANLTGNVTGNADTVTNATLTTALTVNTGTLTLTADAANNSVLTIGPGASSISGTNTGDNTVATTGDAAVDFFGAGVTAVTDATTCTDIEGRSLTIATGVLNADAELYTDTKCIYWENPVDTDDFKSIWFAKNAATITSIWAESDQTVTFMLQVDDGTPADVDSVDLAPAAGTAEDTSLDGDTTMAAGDRLDMAVTSVANTPTWCSVCFTFTRDD